MNEDTGVDAAHRRLEALDARIAELRHGTDEYDHGGPGPKYCDSGSTHPELDDQSIAP